MSISVMEHLRIQCGFVGVIRRRLDCVQSKDENDLLAQADAARQSGPNSEPDSDLKVRTVLDRAAKRIAGKCNEQAEALYTQTLAGRRRLGSQDVPSR